ncbi:DUF2399 domain-containing protein [Actinokineospora sp.]|uniref:DUF2399 domain-containing protein n=1 Tax=Actinokineospora sp. TaxID=1872133 RepID=UPI003D6C40D7
MCLSGHASVAAAELLASLATEGAGFAYHGDFGWGGLRIANWLSQQVSWQPWRFDSAAYRQALATVSGDVLAGKPVDATWDLDLRPSMKHAGRKIEEELLLSDLMSDLAITRRRD